MADTQFDNLSGQLTILKSALEGLAISIGEILMPTIKNIVAKVQSFVDWLNNLSDAQKETIVKVATVVVALDPMLLIVGKLTSTVGSAGQPLDCKDFSFRQSLHRGLQIRDYHRHRSIKQGSLTTDNDRAGGWIIQITNSTLPQKHPYH